MKKLKTLCISFLVLGLVSGTLYAQNLKIFCIDVDQGSSTLIVTPNNKSILIDVGYENTTDTIYDVIKNKAGLNSVNYFVCTHYHKDHYAAIDKLIDKGIQVTDKFYDRNSEGCLGNKANETDYKQYATKAEGKRKYLKPGMKINIENGVDVECIIANGMVKGEQSEIENPKDENGYSLGLIISYNGFDFFIGGDIHKREEKKLVSNQVLIDVDVYHVSHHGANTSSCTELLNVIKPEVCIISNGTNAIYKHPRKKTIGRLNKVSSVQAVFQTNKNTDESTYPNKIKNVADDFIGDLDCEGGEGTILIEVKADTFIVKILSRGIEKAYSIER